MIIHSKDPKEIKKLIAEKKTVILDFWADWCGPCKHLGKDLEAIDKKFGAALTIIKIDIDAVDRDALEKAVPEFNDVMKLGGIPVLMFFKDGERINEYVDKDKDGLGLIYGRPPDPAIIPEILKKYGFNLG